MIAIPCFASRELLNFSRRRQSHLGKIDLPVTLRHELIVEDKWGNKEDQCTYKWIVQLEWSSKLNIMNPSSVALKLIDSKYNIEFVSIRENLLSHY